MELVSHIFFSLALVFAFLEIYCAFNSHLIYDITIKLIDVSEEENRVKRLDQLENQHELLFKLQKAYLVWTIFGLFTDQWSLFLCVCLLGLLKEWLENYLTTPKYIILDALITLPLLIEIFVEHFYQQTILSLLTTYF